MIHDRELRRLLEQEGDRAREEYHSLSSYRADEQVSRKREQLRKRWEEVDSLLGNPLPHDRIIRNQNKNQFVTLAIALVLLVFAVVWGLFALGTKAKIRGIDANVQQLIERFKEQGLEPR